jgi:hypothetical protein
MVLPMTDHLFNFIERQTLLYYYYKRTHAIDLLCNFTILVFAIPALCIESDEQFWTLVVEWRLLLQIYILAGCLKLFRLAYYYSLNKFVQKVGRVIRHS